MLFFSLSEEFANILLILAQFRITFGKIYTDHELVEKEEPRSSRRNGGFSSISIRMKLADELQKERAFSSTRNRIENAIYLTDANF